MNKLKLSFKGINYKLFGTLLLMGLIPTIYTTVRIFFLGQLPDSWGFNIASQLSWVNLLYEIVQETLILPLFYFIGKAYKKGNKELNNTVRTGAIVTFGIYAILSAVLMIFVEPLIKLMAQDTALISQTATYIRLETIANIFATLVKFFIVVLVTTNKKASLFLVLGFQMVLSILLDTFFVSTLKISLNLGVNGVAYTNIIVNILLVVLVVVLLYKNDIKLFTKEKLSFRWMKEFVKVGGLSGLETLVRNLAFMYMIVRMVNVVGEQGTFWVANNFIWGWLLLPVLQLGELIKRDCGEQGITAVREKGWGYVGITTIIVIIWGITIPIWQPFMQHVMQISNASDVVKLIYISVGFYVLFAFNNVIDSTFYGIGRTDLMLVQSVVINSVYYGIMFVLYKTGVYVPTITTIALMFAGGTALDSVLTFCIFGVFLRKRFKKDNIILLNKES